MSVRDCPAFLKFCREIPARDEAIYRAALARHDTLTKPPGSLGRLEELGARYAAVCGSVTPAFSRPTLLNFAADHHIAEEGVSAFPQAVTLQMVRNFSNGGAAINVLMRQAHGELVFVDLGVCGDTAHWPHVRDCKIREGASNFTRGPAMTEAEALRALCVGVDTANEAVDAGATILGTGEMGIANTTPAAAVVCALTNLPPEEIVGRGTGIDDAQLRHKIDIVRKGLALHKDNLKDPLSVLAAVGGFDIAGMCGAFLGGVARGVPVVADGFISGAAALLAIHFAPQIKESIFFAHRSEERGHAKLLDILGVEPMIDLGLHLGEGTGAALAFPIISSAVAILNDMATFDGAGIPKKDEGE